MNPSASGWIPKYESLVKTKKSFFFSKEELYLKLRKTGFIYGTNIGIPDLFDQDNDYSEDEFAKINLITALFYIYILENQNAQAPFKVFLEKVVEFYEELESDNISFLDKFFTGSKKSVKLEKFISSRVYIDENILTKSFNRMLTNSLLFIDVLSFRKYLTTGVNAKDYARKLENIIINLTYHTLNSKEEKTKHDLQLVKLFESSISYSPKSDKSFDGSYRDELKKLFDPFEQKYFLDLACFAAWDDKSLEYKESDFIKGIGKDLKLTEESINESLNYVELFYDEHLDEVSIFKSSNPVKQFYDNSAQLVKKLIIRNKKRLLKEISESKELLVLITKSTSSELTEEEKKKMKDQLLDIFKTIPSLAIFALPGGAILLPLFVKLIPKLLPSAFDDNRIEESD